MELDKQLFLSPSKVVGLVSVPKPGTGTAHSAIRQLKGEVEAIRAPVVICQPLGVGPFLIWHVSPDVAPHRLESIVVVDLEVENRLA